LAQRPRSLRLLPHLGLAAGRQHRPHIPDAERPGRALACGFMTATNDETAPVAAPADDSVDAQFGPHRFYAGEGGGSEQFRGARFDVADLRGARFTDCDLTGVTIRDCWLVDVSISGYVSNVTVNGVDVAGFVSAELDRRHPERVQLREARTAADFRAMWETIERLWAAAIERAGRLPAAALTEQVNEEWSFAQTLRHLIFITDAWASRTVLDEPRPYHLIGLPQSWYPAADAAALGIDLGAEPSYADILAARADRMAVIQRILTGLTDHDLGRLCRRSPAPGYPDEERPVADCLGVVMDEEIEHYRFAVRDLQVLEGRGGERV
jgi:DinB superfamily/Pentapeptide repeats (8 copies)